MTGYIRSYKRPDKCPVCRESYNASLGPGSKLTSPDEGDWCFSNGWFFIHEQLVWHDDSEGL